MHLVSLPKIAVKRISSSSKMPFRMIKYGKIQIDAPVEYVVVQGQKGPQAAKAQVVDE